jgi:2-polyprenyl-3-methyl-5-hydroxy-6-metoxy-1,4-benzoquinol methylase
MKLDQHYVDPRLVALYDLENPRGADTDFYIGLAAELDAHTIIDLGCGTGLLTHELASDGRKVILSFRFISCRLAPTATPPASARGVVCS